MRFPGRVVFCGPDPAVLKSLSAQAEQIMNDEPTATLVTNNWEPEAPVLMVDYYQPIARKPVYPVRMSAYLCSRLPMDYL